jgi:DNA polymerase I-like protein with 3'-5' exonuclease and polymerase domains
MILGPDFEVEWLSETLAVPRLPLGSVVAVDTETSGLYVDDGARVSVVSIAWWSHTPKAAMGDPDDLVPRVPYSMVFPFDHGFFTPLGEKLVDPLQYPKSQRHRMSPSLFDDESSVPNLPPGDFDLLLQWLELHNHVYQNAKFDLHFLSVGLRGREPEGSYVDLSGNVVWDTQVVNPVLWPEFPTGLKPTAERLWGVQESQAQRNLQKILTKNGYRFDLVPWELLEPYAAQDAELTLRLYERHLWEIESGECGDPHVVMEVCEREVDLAICLFRMERRGVGFNHELSLVEADRLNSAALVAADSFRLEQLAHFPKRYEQLASVPAVTESTARAFWFNKPTDPQPGLGLKPVKETAGGQSSVAKDVVASLVKRGVPGADHYERYNQCSTAASMWYTAWAKAVGDPDPMHHPEVALSDKPKRLRTNYRQSRTQSDKGNLYSDQGGTISGRLAVDRIQLQAIPHDYQLPRLDPPLASVRSLFCADPGYQLWELDLSQAEFRVAAGISKCQKMIDAIEAGDWDAHDSTTMLMFKCDKTHPRWKFLRNVAKRLNFGMVYGAGAGRIQSEIELYTGEKVPMEQLQQWLDDFRMTFPELGRASRAAARMAERRHLVPLAGGRMRWFSPYEPTHKAFNAQIQGGVAEMMKVAMVDIEANHPGVLLLQIHDSIIPEVPDTTEGLEIVEDIRRLLVRPFIEEFGVTFTADAKVWS